MATALIKIEYIGAEASCIIEIDEAAGTITSSIGAAGSEAPDANFGAAGVIDISGAAYDTVGEIVEAVDGYTDYSAELVSGLEDYSCDGLADQYLQAKSVEAFIPITVNSIIDTTISLVTWERVQADLNLSASDQENAERYINVASAMANRYTRRILKASDYSKYYPGNGKDFILLPQYPVNSITTLKLDSSRNFGADTEISDTNYDLDSDNGIIYLFVNTAPEGRKTISIEYNAGFTSIPEDLQSSVVECVAWLYNRLPGNGVGIKTESVGDVSITSELGLPVSIKTVWDDYKDRRL